MIKRYWWVWLLLAAITFIAYSNSFKAPFVFDDVGGIQNEIEIRDIGWIDIYNRIGQTRGLTQLTFAFTYALTDGSVVYHHIVSFGIHVISSFLVFIIGFHLAKKSTPQTIYKLENWSVSSYVVLGLIAALIFALHPLQTNAVTYLSQRLVSLATMFYFASLVSYIYFRISANPKIKWTFYGLVWASLLLAMHSKEISITAPATILLIELIFFTKNWRNYKPKLPWLAPILTTVLIVPLIMMGATSIVKSAISPNQEITQSLNPDNITSWTDKISRQDYLVTQFNVIRTYLRLLILPANLTLDYDYPISSTLFELKTIASLLLHLLLLGLAIKLFRKHKLITFGIIFFYMSVSPDSSIVPLQEIIFEYRIYLSMLGFALIASYLAINFIKSPRVLLATILIVSSSLAMITWRRNNVWADEIRLWELNVSQSPNKARPYNNLGFAYLKQNKLDIAEATYKKELAIKPDSASALNNLGNIYGKSGRYDEALETLHKALRIKPDHGGAYNNLGNVHFLEGRLEQAIDAYQKSIAINTQDVQTMVNLGNSYAKLSRNDAAAIVFRQALAIQPNNPNLKSKLNEVLARENKLPVPEEQAKLEEFVQANPDDPVALGQLATAYLKQNRLDKAEELFSQALFIDPNNTVWLNNLAVIYGRRGDAKKAKATLEQALSIDPSDQIAKENIKKLP